MSDKPADLNPTIKKLRRRKAVSQANVVLLFHKEPLVPRSLSQLQALTMQPMEKYYVCCYVGPDGFMRPNVETADVTTKGCARKAYQLLGLTRYRRKKEGWKVLPFRIVFRPDWMEIDE